MSALQASAQALAKEASEREAQARTAANQAAGAQALVQQQGIARAQATEACKKAAVAQVRADVTKATPDQVQTALPELKLSREEAKDFLNSRYKKWEDLSGAHVKRFKDKKDNIGFGRKK